MWGELLGTADFRLRYTEFLQNNAEWAKIGKPGLKQVEADKRRKTQRPFTHKKRAALDTERQRNHDE